MELMFNMHVLRISSALLLSTMIISTFMICGSAFCSSENKEPPVGWCAYYPIYSEGADEIGKTGASMLSVIGSGWGIWSNENHIDFGPMDAQIELAKKNALKLALISETNPVYSQAWMNERTRAAGQNAIGCGGSDAGIPTYSSPIFREAQDRLIWEVTNHVKQSDKDGTIEYYHPGCEWWFPYSCRYNRLEIDHFREWLRVKYETIDALNQQWRADYKAFDDVPAPRLDLISGSPTEMGRLISPDLGQEHCSWSIGGSTGRDTPKELLAIVEPGKRYDISCWIKTEDLQGPGAFIEVAWISASGGPPISGNVSNHLSGINDWTYVQFTARVPKGAGRAWVLLKMAGTGSAWYDDVRVCEQGSDVNLVPNPGFDEGSEQPVAWSFQNWTGGSNVENDYLSSGGRMGSRCVAIRIKPLIPPYGNVNAAVYDWSTFWYEFAADYINHLSGIYKKYDEKRQTVSWLTFSFGYPAEWDYSQQMSISPDEVAVRGKNIDVIGMQICAADGDPYRATADLDLVRKYGKPMWAVDLIDFTSGVHIGYSKMNKITQSVIQHGAQGIVYCLWYLPGAESYSFYQHWNLDDMNKMLNGAKSSMKLMKGYHITPDVALIEPIMPASPVDERGFKNDYRSFIGWYKILERTQLAFDVVTLKEIERGTANANKYKLIVIPDCAYLPIGALEKFLKYSKSGGTIISGGSFGLYDESANPILPTTMEACKRIRLHDYGKEYTGTLIRDSHADTNTPPLFLWGDDTPKRKRTLTNAYNVLNSEISKLNLRSHTEIHPRNDSIRSVVHEKSGKKAYYLVNMGDMPIEDQDLYISDYTKATVSINADGVKQSADVEEVDVGSGNRRLEVRLPKFETSCIVFVE